MVSGVHGILTLPLRLAHLAAPSPQMLCTCPLDELDFDEYLKRHVGMRRFLGFVLIVLSASTVNETSVVAILGMLIMCGGKRVHEKHAPRGTMLISLWFGMDLLARYARTRWGRASLCG